MDEKFSFPPGSLAVVATPIGNRGDFSERALDALDRADVIAAEDTRTLGRLLRDFGITTPLISYHDWNEDVRAAALTKKLGQGQRVALISEAGTPAISDPGFDLVRQARAAGLTVFPVPGACAVTAFLSVSGLPTDAFTFSGFPPNRSGKRRALFTRLADREETQVFYESPHRTIAALEDALEIFGDREAALGREMTKTHEEFLSGPLTSIIEKLKSDERDRVRGEVCWGVRGAQKGDREVSEEELERHALEALGQDKPIKAIAKELSAKFDRPTKELYTLLHKLRSDR